MTVLAAFTELKTLSFAGLVNSYDFQEHPPGPSKLPALVIEHASYSFVEGLTAWNIPATKGNFLMFVDHVLLLDPINVGLGSARFAKITTYLDLYMAAVSADMYLDSNLVVPLKIIVAKRGVVWYRKRSYSGIRFTHRWELRY